ncbi:phosphodiester glycosidase family protein [Ochrobactrum sp. BD67]
MILFKRHLSAAALTFAATLALAQSVRAEACNSQTFENTNYIICEAKADGLHLFWKNADGEPYRNFSKLADAAVNRGKNLVFALNAGMYQPDFSPMGLYVEDGRELRPVSKATPPRGSGPVPNFYKKPNGVFYLDDKGAEILPTDRFMKQRIKPRLATQSGPMLVIGNRINPIFILGSTDKTRRSGVGVCDGGAIRFAASEDAVNFHDFAKLFRDHLQCPNALFLDGGGGAGIYVPALERNDISWHGGYGPMFGFVE